METQTQLPTASEARARIEKLDSVAVDAQWNDISHAINVAIEKGEEYISYVRILQPNKFRLERMGYSCIYRQFGYNEYEWKISW